MRSRFNLLLDAYLGDGLGDDELEEFLTLLHDPTYPEREEQLASLLLTREQVTRAAAQTTERSLGPTYAAPAVPTVPAPNDERRGWANRGVWGAALVAALVLFLVWWRAPGPDGIVIKGPEGPQAPNVQLYLDTEGGEALRREQTVVSGARVSVSAYCRQTCVLTLVDVFDGAATRVGATSYALSRRETVSVGAWGPPQAVGTHTLTALAVDPASPLAKTIEADAERWAIDGPPRGVGIVTFPLTVTHGD